MLSKKIALLFTFSLMLAFQGCRQAPATATSPLPGTATTAPAIPPAPRTIQITSSPRATNIVLPPSGTLPMAPTASPVPGKATPLAAIPTVAPQIPMWLLISSYGGFSPAIDLMRLDAQGQRPIFEDDLPLQWPFWAPNGQWIAFTMYSDSGTDIYIMRPDGSDLQRLTDTPTHKTAYSWSPDGKSIVFSQVLGNHLAGDDVQVDLYILDVETRVIRQLTDTPGVNEHSPFYSPQGDAIAFVQVRDDDIDDKWYLMLIDPNGSNLRTVTTEITTGVGGKLSWSPDGSKIVFSSESEDQCSDLYIVSSDGSSLRQLTPIPGSEIDPAWSPDGNWIVFMGTSACNGGSALGWDILLIRPDGSDLMRVPTLAGRSPSNPAWAPLPGLKAGGAYTVTEAGAFLNLRSAPSLQGQSLAKLDEGEEILVLEGPVETESYLWWRVRAASSAQEGWIAETPGWFREK